MAQQRKEVVVVSDKENSEGYAGLKKGLDAVQKDMILTQQMVKDNRKEARDVSLAIQQHEKNTAVTGQKVDTVVGAVTRIEDKMDAMVEKVAETATHGLDTREGLSRTRKDVALMQELVLRHDEKLGGAQNWMVEYRWLLIPGIGAILVFIAYYIDKPAADATLAAIKGWF